MTLDLDPIRARLAAATPGPWHAYGNTLAAEVGRCTCSPHYGAHERSCGLEDIGQVVESDAELIAHAPADLAALVAEVERLRETVQRVREALEKDVCPCGEEGCRTFIGADKITYALDGVE